MSLCLHAADLLPLPHFESRLSYFLSSLILLCIKIYMFAHINHAMPKKSDSGYKSPRHKKLDLFSFLVYNSFRGRTVLLYLNDDPLEDTEREKIQV